MARAFLYRGRPQDTLMTHLPLGSTRQPARTLLDAVQQIVAAKVQDYAEQMAVDSSTLLGPVERRFKHSVLQMYHFAGRPEAGLVAKIHLGPKRHVAAEAEYHNLRVLHEHFGDRTGLRVPRPLDRLLDFDVIVMERIYAPRLDEVIRTEAQRFVPRSISRSERACRAVGLWLRRLLELEPPAQLRTGGLDSNPQRRWSQEFAEMQEDLSQLGVSSQLAADLNRVFCEHPIPHQPVRALHNDFAPYNTRGSNGSLFVMDFSEMPNGFGDQCAAFFWTWLEISKLHPLLSGRVLSRCQQSFLAGYGRDVSAYWNCWSMVRHGSYLEPPNSRDSRHVHAWKRYRARRLVSWIERAAKSL